MRLRTKASVALLIAVGVLWGVMSATGFRPFAYEGVHGADHPDFALAARDESVTFALAASSRSWIDQAKLLAMGQGRDAAASQGMQVDTRWEGRLEVASQPVNADAGKRRYLLRVVSDVLTVNAGEAPANVRASLAEGAVATFTGQGLLTSLDFAQNAPLMARSLLATVASSLQTPHLMDGTPQDLVMPQGLETSWATVERKGERWDVGMTQIAYRRLVALEALDSAGITVAVSPGSHRRQSFDARGHLAEMSFALAIDAHRAGQRVYQDESRLTLRRQFGQSLADGRRRGDFPHTLPWTPGALMAEASRDAIMQSYRAQAEGESAASLKSAIATAESRDDEMRVYKRVKAYLMTHPEASEGMARSVVDASYDGVAMRTIPVALAAAGSPAAQAALRTLVTARRDRGLPYVKLLPLLASVAAPKAETMAFLEDAAAHDADPFVRGTATLALGNATRQWHAMGGDARDTIPRWTRELSQDLAADRRNLIIDSLGNAGDERSEPALTRLMARSDLPADAKARATYALRFLPSPLVGETLRESATSADSPEARASAIEALAYQTAKGDDVAMMCRILARESAVAVRGAALSHLARSLDHDADARRCVERAAKTDASDEVRRKAANYLSRA